MKPYEARTLDQIGYVTPSCDQWEPMWAALAAATGDPADLDPETGEAWQYMGTYGPVHQFRHRHRPASARPIAYFEGQHKDRVYIDLDSTTLKVVRLNCVLYFAPDRIPAGLADSRAIGQRTEAGREQNRIEQRRSDYGGAFDGFSVSSDADPGL